MGRHLWFITFSGWDLLPIEPIDDNTNAWEKLELEPLCSQISLLILWSRCFMFIVLSIFESFYKSHTTSSRRDMTTYNYRDCHRLRPKQMTCGTNPRGQNLRCRSISKLCEYLPYDVTCVLQSSVRKLDRMWYKHNY